MGYHLTAMYTLPINCQQTNPWYFNEQGAKRPGERIEDLDFRHENMKRPRSSAHPQIKHSPRWGDTRNYRR